MGTRGLYGFLYKGRYYINYQQMDSYPDGLGRMVVTRIPRSPENFKKWIEKLEVKLGSIHKQIESGVKGNFGFYGRPSRVPPQNDLYIEWIYVIDLDRMAFTVDNGAHFRLDNMPPKQEWIRYLGLDGRGARILKPSTPREFVADLSSDFPASEAGLAKFEELRQSLATIEYSDWMGDENKTPPCLQEITVKLVKGLIKHYYGPLSNAYQYASDDSRFQNPATFLLRIAAPGFVRFRVTEVMDKEAAKEAKINRMKLLRLQATKEKKLPSGPRSLYYWFRGCLIVMTNKLDSEDHLHASIGSTVSKVEEKGLDQCTVLLWSINHIAVVSISDRGRKIAHSTAMPFLDAFGRNEQAFISSVKLLMHYLHLPCIGGSAVKSVGVDSQDKDKAAMPFDTISHVMNFVDEETYQTFGLLSHSIRAEWARRPCIGPYVLERSIGESQGGSYFMGNMRGQILTQLDVIHRGKDFVPGWRTDDIGGAEICVIPGPKANEISIELFLPPGIEEVLPYWDCTNALVTGFFLRISEPLPSADEEIDSDDALPEDSGDEFADDM